MLLVSLNSFFSRKINSEMLSVSRDLRSGTYCHAAQRRAAPRERLCHRASRQISVQGISAAVVWKSRTIWVRGPTSLPFLFLSHTTHPPFICMQTLSSNVFSLQVFFSCRLLNHTFAVWRSLRSADLLGGEGVLPVAFTVKPEVCDSAGPTLKESVLHSQSDTCSHDLLI